MAAISIQEGSRQHVMLRCAVTVAVAAVILVAPLLTDNASAIETLTQVACYSVAILGLSLLTGYTGLISIGMSAFVGLGAYTTMILVVDFGWTYLATIPVSIAACLLAGTLVGVPALRIRGLYLVTVTLAVAALFPVLVHQFAGLTGGTDGKFADDMLVPTWLPIDPYVPAGPPRIHYYAIVLIAALAFLVARNIVRSRVGRAMIAVRESELSATSAGVPVAKVKVFAFAISAAFGGLGGSLLVIQAPVVSSTRFDLYLSIFLLVGLIAGGSRTLLGAVPGALIFVTLRVYIADWSESLGLFGEQAESGQIVGVVSGALLLVLIFLLPGGLAEGLARLRRRVLVIRPRPPEGWQRYLPGVRESDPEGRPTAAAAADVPTSTPSRTG